jgi:hypothetical protein
MLFHFDLLSVCGEADILSQLQFDAMNLSNLFSRAFTDSLRSGALPAVNRIAAAKICASPSVKGNGTWNE